MRYTALVSQEWAVRTLSSYLPMEVAKPTAREASLISFPIQLARGQLMWLEFSHVRAGGIL